MSLPFFYHSYHAADNELLELDENTSRHITQVLRMHEGEPMHLTDGMGHLLTAKIIKPHKKATVVRVIEQRITKRKGNNVVIAISPIKNNARFEWFLEKATEIGIAGILPVLCTRTVREHFRFERMQQILISAMLQSQQTWLPVLQQPSAFKDAIAQISSSQKLIAHCDDAGERKQLSALTAAGDVTMLIGPEGDFTPAEIASALDAGFIPVMLGENRLRTETAGLVAATLLCLR